MRGKMRNLGQISELEMGLGQEENWEVEEGREEVTRGGWVLRQE